MGSAIWPEPPSGSGGPPSGAAGGSLTGTYPNPGLVPASAIVPGSMSIADFNKLLGRIDATTLIGVPQQLYAEADWLATAGTLIELAPAVAGYYFIPTSIRTFVEGFTGTATGNWQYSVGTNSAAAAYNNITNTVTITSAGLNALFPALLPTIGTSLNVNGGVNAGWIPSVAMQWKNTLPPTGLTVFSGVILTTGFYLKAAPR